MNEQWDSYLTTLSALVDAPSKQSDREEEVRVRARRQVEVLDRDGRAREMRWAELDAQVERLHQVLTRLARRVGVLPTTVDTTATAMDPAQIQAALDDIRRRLEAADSSWQWVLRFRERQQAQASAPVSPLAAPVAPPPAVVVSAPPPQRTSFPNRAALVIGSAVITLLILVILVLAVTAG